MLSPTSFREVIFAWLPSTPRDPPFFTVKLFPLHFPALTTSFSPRYGSVVVVINLLFSWDRGTARTAIQVHSVNLIEIRLGEE